MTIKNFSKGFSSRPIALKTATLLGLALGVSGAGSLPQAHANVIGYDVNFASLGTLAGSSDYNLDFQLTPSGTANSSTSVFFRSFNYGTGSGPTTLDTLTDAHNFNESSSPLGTFTAGNNLSFHFDVNYTPEASPDVLTFNIFSTSTNLNTVTTAPDTYSYFSIDFNGAHPAIHTYAGTNPAFSAPTVTETAPVPEPSTYAMMALGLLALGMLQWKRKHAETENSESELLAASAA